MATTQLDNRKTNQLELSVLISNISLLISSQVQLQDIMEAPVDGLRYPYLAILDLATSEYIKLYNRAIFGIPESDSWDRTRSKWAGFYQ